MTEERDLGVVLYQREAQIARIVLNCPEKANAQSSELVWQVDECLDLAEADYGVKVVILKANGKGFSAGHVFANPDAYPEFTASIANIGKNWIGSRQLFLGPTLRFFEFPKPMIAQVHGYAIGGGTYWAFLPDITIASDDAYFQMPLVQALGFPGGETMVEPWTFMNRKRAAEYLYTAKTLTAAEALDLGLVNRVVPRAQLEETVEEMAAHIAKAPLSTLMGTKSLLVRAWELMGMREHLQMSADVMSVMESTSDAVEARRRMAEAGRKPREMAAAARKEAAEEH
ncbi:MAG TPA: enoyl-CoA hydratase-related protein [Myxococcota bacterium]|nr:enoyl-CoA hydratase-related protein [Myxococcota bacterium]